MNLQQLAYIIAVDRFKSFSQAAEYCHVTQATLSGMIKKLEAELGVVTFDRKVKPILTTDCGQEIIQEAKKVEHHLQVLKDLSHTVRSHITGEVRLGVIPTIASSLLPRILRPISQAYPELQLHVVEKTTDAIIQALKQGHLDLGIIATPWPAQSIEEEVLYYEALMVYGQAAVDRQYLLPEEIQAHPVWLFEEGHCLRDQFINLCSLQHKQAQPANFSFEANSFDTLLNMVDTYGGLTLLPELYCQTLTGARRDRICPFQAPLPVREVSLVYFRPFARYRINRALADLIRSELQGQLQSQQYDNSELVIARV